MDKILKTDVKSLISLAIIGVVLSLLVNYIESILYTITRIIAILTMSDSKYFEFYKIIPEILVLGFWLVIVFKFLKGFSGTVNLREENIRRLLLRIGIITISLLIIQVALGYLSNYIWSQNLGERHVDYKLTALSSSIVSVIGLLEIATIVIGYFKVLRKATTTNNGYSK